MSFKDGYDDCRVEWKGATILNREGLRRRDVRSEEKVWKV